MNWICKKCGTENIEGSKTCESCKGKAPQLHVYFDTDLIYDKVIAYLFADNCSSVRFVGPSVDEDITGKYKYYIKFADLETEELGGWKKWGRLKFIISNDVADIIIEPEFGVRNQIINKYPPCFTDYGYMDVFKHCHLTHLIIPDYVTNQDSRFEGLQELKTIIFPDNIQQIDSFAFQGCTQLESVIFTGEESLKIIGDRAFEGCTKLLYIKLPLNMEKIGYRAFHGCRSLPFIDFTHGLDEIGSEAFKDCTSLRVKDSTASGKISKIGYRAFENCVSLDHIRLPKGLTELEYDSFKGCTSLKTIIFPGSLISIPSVCSGCSSLWRALFEEGVKIIEQYAFSNLPSMDKLFLPDSLEEIQDGAFSECTSLCDIRIPDFVSCIGSYAFCGCCSVEEISVSSKNNTYDSRNNCNAIIETKTNKLVIGCKNTTIPDTVEIIGLNAFTGQSRLQSLYIPASIKKIEIETYGFIGVENPVFETIIVSNDNVVYDSRNNCNAIIETVSDTLIVGCNNTVIPPSVKSIAVGAFQGCSSLKEIELPDTLESIGPLAFSDCKSLETITIPPSVSEIYGDAFVRCDSIRKIVMPKDIYIHGRWMLDSKSIKYYYSNGREFSVDKLFE